MRRISTRWAFPAAAGLALVLGLLASGAPPAYAADPLVVSIWGGHWKETIEQAAGVPFTKLTGIAVEYDVGETTDRLAKARATRTNPQADVVFTTSHVARLYASDNLLETIPRAGLSHAAEVRPETFRGDTAVGLYATIYTIAVRTDLVSLPIAAWADLWNPALKGKVLLPSFDPSHIIVAAARLEGGNEFTWEKGWERLRALKPNIAAFYATGVQSIEMMRRGEAGVAVLNSPNIYTLQKEGLPVKLVIPREKAIVNMDVAAILRGSRNRDAAVKFVDLLLSPEVQAKIAVGFGVTPMNPKAVLPEDLKAKPGVLDTAEKWAAGAYVIDDAQRATMLDTWKERFRRDVMAN
jgi:putative spermidine/putrescine transport system substrate-binding protein